MARRPRPNIPRPSFAFTVTTPINTPSTAPQITTHTLRRGFLDTIEIEIPPGHVGITGIAWRLGGRQLWPFNEGEFVRGDDDLLVVPVEVEMSPTGRIQVATFNRDNVHRHTHIIRYYMRLETEVASPIVTPIDPVLIEQAS